MALTAALFVTVSGQSRAGLINGSFEAASPGTGITPPTSGTSGYSLPSGSTAMQGWTVFGGHNTDDLVNGLAWLASNNPNEVYTPFGSEYVDLSGFHYLPPFGLGPPYFGVSQTISTTPGQSYNLSFWLGMSDLYSAPTIGVKVNAGPVTETVTDAAPYPTGGAFPLNYFAWTQFVVDFTANSNASTIAIQGIQGGSFIGLDNVSLNTVNGVGFCIILGVSAKSSGGGGGGGGGATGGTVPEPGSLILGGIATISGLGRWWLQRRKWAAA